MGGYGSGRQGQRQKTEQFRSLNVNVLHRAGCLKPGWSGRWQWAQNGGDVAQIGMRSEPGCLILDYRFARFGEPWESVTEHVRLTSLPCHYGGERPYFVCPGFFDRRACQRRVGKLFAASRYFLCRHCHGLGYSSQSEARYDRMLRRANKRRMALGGEAGTANMIARKPKGMWHRTYARHRFEIEWCEDQANHDFIARYLRYLSPDEQAMFLER